MPSSMKTEKVDGISERSLHFILGLILVAVCFAVYGNTLHGFFLQNWDDNKYVVENAAAHGFSLSNVKDAFTQYYVGNYAPLQILSYSLDYTLWGLNPFGFHVTNVCLAAMCGILFYSLLWLLYQRHDISFAAALLFIVHPVQVETVAWISQRKNLLSMLFFLLAMICYLLKEKGGKRWYFLSLGSFLLALLAKSVAVILPVTLLLLDITLLGKKLNSRVILEKIPYILLAGGCAVLALISQGSNHDGGITSYHGGTPYRTFLTMLPVFASYIRMFFWPSGLSSIYLVTLRFSFFEPQVLASCVLLVSLMILSVYFFRKRRDVSFWCWFVILAFLPVSQIVPLVTLMNDRYMYFPMLGFSSLAGITLSVIREKGGTGSRIAFSLAFLAIITVLAVTAHERNKVWKDAFHLWSDAVVKSPGHYYAHQGLANVFENMGKLEEAAREYRTAIDINPTEVDLYNQLGLVYVKSGKFPLAQESFQTAVRLKPSEFSYVKNLGISYVEMGRFNEAIKLFTSELTTSPANLSASCMLAAIYEKIGDTSSSRYYHTYAFGIDKDKAAQACGDIYNNFNVNPGASGK